MRTAILSLSCFLVASTAFTQQATPGASPAKPATPATVTLPSAEKGPLHPLTDAQAAQMLEILGGNKIKEEITSGMTNYFHTRLPFAPQDVNDDLKQSLQKLDVNAPIIAIYKRHISTEDADSIIAFYKTPAGKDMIEAMPEVLQQSQQEAAQLARQTAQEVVDRHRPEIDAAAKQYQQEHMPKPAPSLGSPSPAAPNAAPAAKPAAPAPQPQ